MVFLPLEFKLIALGMVILRYFITLFIFSRNARRLGEQGLKGRHFIYDFIEPALRLMIAMCSRKKLGRRGY